MKKIEYVLSFAIVLGMSACGKPASPADSGKKTDGKKMAASSQPASSQPASSQPASSQPASSQPMKKMGKGARVFFVWPEPNSTVATESDFVFGIEGMTISKVGERVEDKSTGHHHLIIDKRYIKYGQVVPADPNHIHFGGGQTSARVKLKPGTRTLTMQLADGAHRSYGKGMSSEMKVKVVELPTAPKVSFVEPADGATVKSPFKVKFGLSGMTISPAGSNVLDKTKGHHHVIVDGKPLPAGSVVPANATHIHFGKGQTETELKLKPGKHTLTLQFADGGHRSYGPAMSSTITVQVAE